MNLPQWACFGEGCHIGVSVQLAAAKHAEGICRVCADGWRATYEGLYPKSHIERTIKEFYNPDRVKCEITTKRLEWWVALDDDGSVVGAGGGDVTGDGVGELFVLYVDPARRGERIGTMLLQAVIGQLREKGAKELWASVAKGNQKGIPFYEARGFIKRGERRAYSSDPKENLVSCRYSRTI